MSDYHSNNFIQMILMKFTTVIVIVIACCWYPEFNTPIQHNGTAFIFILLNWEKSFQFQTCWFEVFMTALTMMVQADQEKGGRQTGLNCLVNFPSNLSDMMISGYLMYTTHCMYLCAVLAFIQTPGEIGNWPQWDLW